MRRKAWVANDVSATWAKFSKKFGTCSKSMAESSGTHYASVCDKAEATYVGVLAKYGRDTLASAANKLSMIEDNERKSEWGVRGDLPR